jgi:hypothetical protein
VSIQSFPIQSNAKSPDVPGAVDIATPSVDVSHTLSKKTWAKKAVEERRKSGQDGPKRF